MATGPPTRSPRSPQQKFVWILLIVLLSLTTGILFVLVKSGKVPQGFRSEPAEKTGETARALKETAPEPVRKPIPAAEPRPSPEQSAPLPPDTYPDVSPQAPQEERKEAFGLKSSVDHVVQRKEPFEAHGRQWTIEEIERRLASRPSQTPQETEATRARSTDKESLGGFARKSQVTQAGEASPQRVIYYGVRLVRPGENLWEIHYGVVREYFSRRGVDLPLRADEPRPDGRSTGVGRLLKFLESIVHVYDSRQNRLVENLHLLHPNDLIVFFNISDVFGALDHVDPKDLESLRYLGPTLQLKAPSRSRVLVDRKSLKPPLNPPGSESHR